jgi:actin-related protein
VVQGGYVQDWEGAEQLWARALQGLGVEGKEEVALLAAPLEEDRERICEVLLETFGLRGAHLASQEALGMADLRQWSGVSVVLGAGHAQVVPFLLGSPLPHAALRLPLSGQELTDLVMANLVWERAKGASKRYAPHSPMLLVCVVS